MQTNPASINENFYASLPVFSDFPGVTDERNFHDVPEDWLVFVSDIKGSTRAIENGRYKEVNILGASSIIAVLNCVGGIEIPFVFGGDGASFVVPPSRREAVENALRVTCRMARERFAMELRVGAVPVKSVLAGGSRLRVAKMRVSPWGTLAMFSGGGLAHAEKLIKDSTTGLAIPTGGVDGEDTATGLFSGLECRWEPIKSKNGETLSLMVLATGRHKFENADTYSGFLAEIRKIYGPESSYSPVSPDRMKVTLNPKLLSAENGVCAFGKSFLGRLAYPVLLLLACLLGRIIFKFGLKIGDMDGKLYIETLTRNSDFQKFDDTLRMTIDSTPRQREQLVRYLDARMNEGALLYGMHVSDSALMTCMVFDRKERHLHFVDGSSGGYALAAKQIKKQMAGNK